MEVTLEKDKESRSKKIDWNVKITHLVLNENKLNVHSISRFEWPALRILIPRKSYNINPSFISKYPLQLSFFPHYVVIYVLVQYIVQYIVEPLELTGLKLKA